MAIIPAGSLAFSGFGDSNTLRFLSPLGVDLGRPTTDPDQAGSCNGIIALPGTNAIGFVGCGLFTTTGIGTLNANLTVRGDYTGGSYAGTGGDRDQNGFFYVAKIVTGIPNTSTNWRLQVFRYDPNAVLSGSWDIQIGLTNPAPTGNVSVSWDGGTVYVTTYQPSFTNWTVYAASLAGAGSWIGAYVVRTGSHQAQHMNVPGTSEIIIADDGGLGRYSAAGALLASYSVPNYTGVAALAKGQTSATFWVSAYCSGVATSSGVTIAEIRYSDGAILHAFDPADGSFEFDSPFTVLLAPTGTATSPALPPVSPQPDGPRAPCTPQSQVSGGGMGAAGCNTGGVGRDPVVFDAVGDVPVHADAAEGELLWNKRGADLWIALHHVNYPSGSVTTYRRALTELADLPAYMGGRKPMGLLAVGDVEHGLGNETGGFEAAAVELQLSDAIDRWIRGLLTDQDLEGDELEIYLATSAARAAGATPRTLMRAVIQGPRTDPSLRASLTAVDSLFSLFGPFGTYPSWPFWTIGDVFPLAPADVKSRALPVLYGPKTDRGAKDPATNTPKSKGLVPWHWIGQMALTGGTSIGALLPTSESAGIGTFASTGILGGPGDGWTSDGTVTNDPYHAWARVVAGVMGPLNGGRSSTPSPTGTVYGFRHVGNDSGPADYYISFQIPPDLPTWDPFTNPAPGRTDIRYQIVPATPSNPFPDWQFIAYWQRPDSGQQWGAAAAAEEIWDAFVVLHGASWKGDQVFVSDMGNGNPQATPDRVAADIDARNGSDLLWPWASDGTIAPAWSAIFGAQTYVDQVGADGNVYRLTMGFARGAVADAHKNGVVNITCNMIAGREDVGDGTGLPIIEAHKVEQHWLENDILSTYRSGLWVTNTTAPKWSDGTYKLRSTRFADRQAYTAVALGGRGLTVGWYVADQRPLPTWFKLWNDSTETTLGTNGHGQVSLGYLDRTTPASDWPRVDHVTGLFGSTTVATTYNVARENSVALSADYDPEAQKFRIGPIILANATAIAKYKGRRKPGQPIESTILDDETQLRWVGNQRLARLGGGLTIVQITGQCGLVDYDVDTAGLLLTTIEGRGAWGYVNQPMLIRRRKFAVASQLVTDTLWDVSDLLLFPPGSTNTLFLVTDDTGAAPVVTDDAAVAPIPLP